MGGLLDTLGELIGGVGYALDTPGALVRGALSGRIGERASGKDLLSSLGLLNEDSGFLGDVAGYYDVLHSPASK